MPGLSLRALHPDYIRTVKTIKDKNALRIPTVVTIKCRVLLKGAT